MRTDVENISDHHHLCLFYCTGRMPSTNHGVLSEAVGSRRRSGWPTARMDSDLLFAAVITVEWMGAPAETEGAELRPSGWSEA